MDVNHCLLVVIAPVSGQLSSSAVAWASHSHFFDCFGMVRDAHPTGYLLIKGIAFRYPLFIFRHINLTLTKINIYYLWHYRLFCLGKEQDYGIIRRLILFNY